MNQTILQLFLFALMALSLVLYVLNPSYVITLVKIIFSVANFIFAFFVFRHLIDMNNHYKSKLYPILFLFGFGVLAIPVLVILGLFL
jgi:hypothetical protein